MILGDKGLEVEKLQDWLIGIGYLNRREECYGVKTKRAVIEIQKFMEVEPTGEWDDDYYVLFNIKASTAVATVAKESGKTDTKKDEVSEDKNQTQVASSALLKKGTATFTVDYITCYIYNMNTGTMINFGVSTPDEITDSNTANFEDQAVQGRSSPFKAYANSGPRGLSFTIQLVADYCKEGIVQTVNKIRALLYPHKQTVIVEPRCRFVIGYFLRVQAVPVAIDVVWKKPYKDGLYSIAEVSFTLNEVESVGQFDSDIEGK